MSNSSNNQDLDQENSRSKNLFIEEESANESSRLSSSSGQNQMMPMANQDMFTNNFTNSSRNKLNARGKFSKTNGHVDSQFDEQIKKLQTQSQKQLEEMEKHQPIQTRDKIIQNDNINQAAKKKYTLNHNHESKHQHNHDGKHQHDHEKELKEQITSLNQKVSSMHDIEHKFTALKKKHRDCDDEINKLKRENMQLKTQNQLSKNENQQFTDQMAYLDQTIDELNKKLRDNDEQQDESDDAKCKLKNEINELNQKLQEHDELLDESEEQKSQLMLEIEELNGKLNQQQNENLESQQIQIKWLEQLKDQENQLNEQSQEIQRLQAIHNEYQLFQKQYTEEKKEFQKQREENENQRIQIEQYLLQQVQQMNEQQILKKQLMLAQSKIQDLKDKLSQLEKGLAVYIPKKNDQIDLQIGNFINMYPEKDRLRILFLRESEGVYQFGSKRVYIKIDKCNKILVRVGGGFMFIEDFIDQYTQGEVERIQRRNPLIRYQDKLQLQKISVDQSISANESSPIRSPVRAKSRSPSNFERDHSPKRIKTVQQGFNPYIRSARRSSNERKKSATRSNRHCQQKELQRE